jgi:hypothetical protein
MGLSCIGMDTWRLPLVLGAEALDFSGMGTETTRCFCAASCCFCAASLARLARISASAFSWAANSASKILALLSSLLMSSSFPSSF